MQNSLANTVRLCSVVCWLLLSQNLTVSHHEVSFFCLRFLSKKQASLFVKRGTKSCSKMLSLCPHKHLLLSIQLSWIESLLIGEATHQASLFYLSAHLKSVFKTNQIQLSYIARQSLVSIQVVKLVIKLNPLRIKFIMKRHMQASDYEDINRPFLIQHQARDNVQVNLLLKRKYSM